jgi:integrase
MSPTKSRPGSRHFPRYVLHKASGQAVVRFHGKDIYLGKYRSQASIEKYNQLLTRWNSQQLWNEATNPPSPARPLSIAELILRYREFAKDYYRGNGSKPGKEFVELKYALKPLRELFGGLPVNDFGPKSLALVRQKLIDAGLSRGVINRRVNRIKRCFKWGVSEELVPPPVLHGLQSLAGLKFGRTTAPEAPKVKPVSDEVIEATLPYLSPQVAAMVRLQRLTGMRPSEVVSMRGEEIDMAGEVWLYQPEKHKNAWRGAERTIPLGPKAQEILKPFLGRPASSPLFSPIEAEQQRNLTRRAARRTKIQPSQVKRKPKAKPKRAKRDGYDRDSYRRAVTYGITKANRERAKTGAPLLPAWFPLQLRHSRATEIRRQFGIEAAQVALGHSHADVTQIYAERNERLAAEIAAQSG